MSANKRVSILCFGDSNTWGFVPGSFEPTTDLVDRYQFEERWPGKVQLQSNHKFHMYEEGLSGRTINTDDPEMDSRNGLKSIQMLLDTHEPLDLVIVFLGVNDCKLSLSQSADVLCEGYEKLLDVIENSVSGVDLNSAPRIMAVSYPLPAHERGFDAEFAGATEKLRSLNAHIKSLVNQRGHLLFDAAEHIKLSDIDGIHFDLKAHSEFAKQLSTYLNKIYPDHIRTVTH